MQETAIFHVMEDKETFMSIKNLSLAAAVTGLLGFSGIALAGSSVPASPVIVPDDASSMPAVASFRSSTPGVEIESVESLAFAGGMAWTVDDDLAECPNAAFMTIQAAVDAAALDPGANTIKVCPGTYPENVLIGAGNRLKLKGSGVGSTFVTGVAGTAGPIIDVISADKVHVEDLTVDGASALAGGVVIGIRYDMTDGKIKDVEVLNIRNVSGSSQGIGIRVQSAGAATKVKIDKTHVSNYTRVGINGNGVGVELEVKKSTVVGPVPPTVWAPNGIQVSRGAVGKIKNNTVDNNPSPNVPGGAGSGIILFCAGDNTEVKENTVTKADLGISIVDNALAKVERNDVLDSDFDAISLQFLGLFFGDIGCTAPGAPLPVEYNEVYRNTLKDSGDTGISFANFDLATDPATPNDNRIENNDIMDSVCDGIHIFDGEFNLLEKNDIAASGSTDAADDTTGGGTAGTANTWKKNDCTTSSPPGLCD